MNTLKAIAMTVALVALVLAPGPCLTHAAEKSRYMGGEATLVKAPNGALVNSEVLEVNSKILYLEPTTEKVAGVLDLFDKFVPGRNTKIPSLED